MPLSQEPGADTLGVIEVAKSSPKHYLVTREGIFYPIRSGTNLAKLEIIAAKNREIAIDASLNNFIAYLKSYILPMFPGSFLAKTVISSPSQDIAPSTRNIIGFWSSRPGITARAC